MNLILPSEVATFAPQVSRSNLLRTDAQKRPYIAQASTTAEGFCFRSQYGFEVRELYNIRVDLDINLTGRLPNTPVIEFLNTNADVFYFGQSNRFASLRMSDFSIDPFSGLIRNLSMRGLESGEPQDTNFRNNTGYKSILGQTQLQYHVGKMGSVEDNSYPYYMNVDFRAGLFAEKVISPSGGVDSDFVIVEDVIGLRKGAEFYFSTDPVQEPDVDKRYITDIDIDNSKVYFKPRLVEGIASGEKLRQIDRSVRAACGEIIADMITYPANTKTYIKNLGKFDLQKQWVRRNGFSVSAGAAEKLEPYTRV